MHFELFDLVYILSGALGGGIGVALRYRQIVDVYNNQVKALRNLADGLFDDLMIERDLTSGLTQELADAAAKKTTARRK